MELPLAEDGIQLDVFDCADQLASGRESRRCFRL
jgi:hypothetical protein